MKIMLISLLLLASPSQHPPQHEQTAAEITRAELEARAQLLNDRMANLQRQTETLQHEVSDNQAEVARLKGRQDTWGTLLTLLSGGSLGVGVFTMRKKV